MKYCNPGISLQLIKVKYYLFQFQSLITKVQWVDDIWSVTYMKTDSRENITEQCNFVVVATGQYSSPNIPHFEGQEEFEGNMLLTPNGQQ